MLCLNCNNQITIKRNILNLFSLKKEYICLNCFNKLNFELNEILLPVDNKYIIIYSLLTNTENFKYSSLINEASSIYNKLNKYHKLIINLNRFYLCDKNYEFLELLSKHHNNNIILLVYELFD